MTDGPEILAIAGSLREESYTRLALEHALEGVEQVGGSGTLLDLREYELPTFDADKAAAGDADELKRAVRSADSVLLGTPIYHGSYSSTLKTALDYCGFDEFEDETVGLLAVAGGQFPVTALEHLRTVCRALNAWVIPHQVAIPRAHSAFDDGTVVDENLAERTRVLGQRAVHYADIEPDPACFEGQQNVGAE